MDIRIGRPRVAEEAACQADQGRKDSDGKTAFRDWNIIVVEGGPLIVGVLEKAGQGPKKETNEDGYLEEATHLT